MKTLPLLCLLSLPLAACGEPADATSRKDDAYLALNGGDALGALAGFDQLLGEMDPSAPDFVEVSVARCQALAGVDPERAKRDFLILDEAHDLEIRDYTAMSGQFLRDEAFLEAIEVCEAGCRAYPDDLDRFEQLKSQLARRAATSGSPEVESILKGFGYGQGGD